MAKLNVWMGLIIAGVGWGGGGGEEIAAYNDVTLVLEASDGEDSPLVK